MELGNELFGHSRGQYQIDRTPYQELFLPLQLLLGYQDRHYDNDLFEFHDYCACEKDTCLQCGTQTQPNFHFKPTGLKINWYKYPLRDSYSNQILEVESFKQMVLECEKHYAEHNPEEYLKRTAPVETKFLTEQQILSENEKYTRNSVYGKFIKPSELFEKKLT
jgi:hypothetical protein